MEVKRTKLQQLLLKKEIDNERNKVVNLFQDLYSIRISKTDFMEYDYSNNLKRKGYSKIKVNKNIIVTDYEDLLLSVEKIEAKLKSNKIEELIVFHINDKSGALTLKVEEIFSQIFNRNQEIAVDFLGITKTNESGFCVEVDEHEFFLTCWGDFSF